MQEINLIQDKIMYKIQYYFGKANIETFAITEGNRTQRAL
jgi:hypothetical protein